MYVLPGPKCQNSLADVAQGAEVGWGTAPGFDVAQMEAADLIYAGVPSSAGGSETTASDSCRKP